MINFRDHCDHLKTHYKQYGLVVLAYLLGISAATHRAKDIAKNNFPISGCTVRPELVEGCCGSISSGRTDLREVIVDRILSCCSG